MPSLSGHVMPVSNGADYGNFDWEYPIDWVGPQFDAIDTSSYPACGLNMTWTPSATADPTF